MNRASTDPTQLRSLFNAVCDEMATEEQLCELEKVIRDDEQAWRLYLEQCQLHADLYSTISGQRSQETLRESIVSGKPANHSLSNAPHGA